MFRINLLCLRRTIIVVHFFLLFSVALFARGKQEEKRDAINTEFTLCITAFDVSQLPPAQQILGNILEKELIWDLGRIHHRIRSDEEISRYEELARMAAMQKAAAALAAKRAERDALLFRGVPDWKYKKEIKKIDDELQKLEAAYKKATEETPLIAEKPLFKISGQNTGNKFPVPPEKGKEEIFLKANNADAFLEGKLRLVYGRVFAEFRLYTRGASFIFEDSTIFSQEELNAAADELKSRFLTALVNSEPVSLVVNVEPAEARLELNGRLVQSGETVEISPGPVTVKASADDHESVVKELELEGGTSEEIAFVLKPFTMETINIHHGGPGNLVYMGALYLGGNSAAALTDEVTMNDEAETMTGEVTMNDVDELSDEEEEFDEVSIDTPVEIKPQFFSIYVPVGQYRYIRVETEDGLTGEAIVKGAPGDEVRIITLEPRKLPGKDEKPVEEKRSKFYGAYGRFWIALPVAFLINGVSKMYTNSYSDARTQSTFNSAKTSYYVSIGSWVVAGAFLVETLVRMGIYVNTANRESIPLIE